MPAGKRSVKKWFDVLNNQVYQKKWIWRIVERKEAADLASLFSGFYSMKMMVTYLRSNSSKAPIPIYFTTVALAVCIILAVW